MTGTARRFHQLCRTAGACLGAFAWLNAAGDLFIERFGADFLWIRFPRAVALPGRIVLLGAAVALLLTAFRRISSRRVLIVAEILVGLVALAALWNALGFYALLLSGRIRSWFPFPSSLVIVAILASNAWRMRREHALGARIDSDESARRLALVHGASFVAVSALGPLFLLFAYGATDYSPMVGGRDAPARPPADCIIVYGARVYADGRASHSLYDRVNEGIRLWHAGRGRHLVVSGGGGDGEVSEPQAMRRLAVRGGVAEGAIVLDEHGFNTFRSAVRAARLMPERGWRASISVSHYYHLLRIQLSARRAGLVTYTVPARMTRRLAREPWFVIREVAAFYGYYFFRWDTGEGGDGGPSGTVAAR